MIIYRSLLFIATTMNDIVAYLKYRCFAQRYCWYAGNAKTFDL